MLHTFVERGYIHDHARLSACRYGATGAGKPLASKIDRMGQRFLELCGDVGGSILNGRFGEPSAQVTNVARNGATVTDYAVVDSRILHSIQQVQGQYRSLHRRIVQRTSSGGPADQADTDALQEEESRGAGTDARGGEHDAAGLVCCSPTR